MEFSGRILILMVCLVMSSSLAYDFHVGGREGWVQNPSVSFNTWAGRNRFRINDRLVFRLNNGEDSVLVVRREDYEMCNTKNPIQRLDGPDAVFRFDRSGPFFFISGDVGRCRNGQRLVVVVMSPGHGKRSPPPTAAPTAPSPANVVLPSPSLSPSQPPVGEAPGQAPASVLSPVTDGKVRPVAGSASFGLDKSWIVGGLVAVLLGGGVLLV